MKAFVERLCDHAGIVRSGPNTEKYGDPFEYACAYLIEGVNLIIKGLVADGGLATAHRVAAFRALKREFPDLKPEWERFK